MVIHAGFQAFFNILAEYIGGHGDNGNTLRPRGHFFLRSSSTRGNILKIIPDLRPVVHQPSTRRSFKLKAEGTAMIGVFHDRDALPGLSDSRYDPAPGGYCAVGTERRNRIVTKNIFVEKRPDEASVTGEFPVTASDGKNYKANSTKTPGSLFPGCLYHAGLIFSGFYTDLT
jgi:hypothetical protein